MKKKVLLMLLFVMMLVLTACGRPDSSSGSDENDTSDSEYSISIAYLVAEDQSTHLAAEDFKERVEENSDGRISVELFANGSLYESDREAIEAVQLGNVEMTIPALAAVSSFNKHMMVFDLPFLFEDYDHVYSVLDGELGEELFDEIEEVGLKGLEYGANGFRHITNNKQPIESPDDLKGQKFRTLESEVQTSAFKTLGANASPFAFGELYTALQQGTYDAMESPISLLYTNKFFEVQDFLTISSHMYAPTALLINNDFYQELPDDLKTVIDEAAEQYRDEQRELAEEQDEEWVEKLEEEGMEVNELTDEQIEEFKEKSEPVYEKYEDKIGKDIIEKAKQK